MLSNLVMDNPPAVDSQMAAMSATYYHAQLGMGQLLFLAYFVVSHTISVVAKHTFNSMVSQDSRVVLLAARANWNMKFRKNADKVGKMKHVGISDELERNRK